MRGCARRVRFVRWRRAICCGGGGGGGVPDLRFAGRICTPRFCLRGRVCELRVECVLFGVCNLRCGEDGDRGRDQQDLPVSGCCMRCA